MSTKRLFIGLGFSEHFAKAAEPWIKKIRKNADRKEVSLKWTPETNYHVTLVFLGNTAEEEIPQLEEKIKWVAQRHGHFTLKIRNISGFPTLNQARVIYFGVQRSQAILDLQSDLENEILPPEKVEHEYSPHLTLARLRNPKSCRDLLSPFEHVDLGKQEVTSLILFNSILSHGYPVYERIAEFELNPNAIQNPNLEKTQS
ncbi:MAG: RNA 2',3'-cyclic phosphodiesterase [Pseudobdellovibrionaceae bacterium]